MSDKSVNLSDRFVELAVEHILEHGPDDVFDRNPFFGRSYEMNLLSDPGFRSKLTKYAQAFVTSPSPNSIGTPIFFSVPKSQYAFRKVAWIHLKDAICYTSLVFSIAELIEKRRAPSDVVFSCRFSGTTKSVMKANGYQQFRLASKTISGETLYNVKVVTDIANFYDRINLHRLESVLADIQIPGKIVKAVNSILHLWAERNSYGLPIGSDASRILAEASLIPVDTTLLRKSVKFVRYVDDFRIFASSYAEAHSYLNTLVEALDKEGLFLNASKTRFIDLNEYRKDQANYDDESEPNTEKDTKFEPIDTSTKIVEVKTVTVGYTAKISRTYRYPGKEMVEFYKNVNIDDEIEKLRLDHSDLEKRLRHAFKAYVYQGGARVDLLFAIIDRYVHSLAYIVDGLIQESAIIAPAIRELIADKFVGYYKSHSLAPYHKVAIVRLLSDKNYCRYDFILESIQNMKFSDPEILNSEIIMNASRFADREMLRALRFLYDSSSPFLRRAIFLGYYNSRSILQGEKDAWFKNLLTQERDEIIRFFLSSYFAKKAAQREIKPEGPSAA